MIAFKPILNLFQAALALGAVFFLAAPAYAQAPIPGYPDFVQSLDAREIAMLPEWCRFAHGFERVPGFDMKKREYWSSLMGRDVAGRPMWRSLHHYCFGMMKINRANYLARDRVARYWYLESSIQEFDFVLDNATRDFVLLPELLTKKGATLLSLGKTRKGIEGLESAIEVKPDYWPAYAALSDHYKGTGDLKGAREWLEKGLSQAPDTTSLKRRLAELDAVKDKRK